MSDRNQFLPLLAAAALLVLLHQLSDLAVLLPGLDLATPAGRVRQLLALEARSPAALTADFALIWAVVQARAPAAARGIGMLHLLLGTFTLVAAPLFLVDAGRVTGDFPGWQATAFRVVAARTLLMLLLLGAGAILAGRALTAFARVTESTA